MQAAYPCALKMCCWTFSSRHSRQASPTPKRAVHKATTLHVPNRTMVANKCARPANKTSFPSGNCGSTVPSGNKVLTCSHEAKKSVQLDQHANTSGQLPAPKQSLQRKNTTINAT